MKADRYRYDDHDRPDLRDLPTHAGVDKDCREEIEEKTAENIETMKELQDALYADGREGIVIVLQAMDAAGKDSTIKHVMSGLNPQGVMVHSFKQPNSEELAHDYLWRVVQHLPAPGQHCHLQPQPLRRCAGSADPGPLEELSDARPGPPGQPGGILPQALSSDPAVRGIPL